ncbi:MAG: CARDB domain-containing protein [archaeon]
MKRLLFALLLIGMVVISGCPPGDEAFYISEEQYLIGWIISNVSNTTNTTITYSPDDLAIYNYTYNYPAQQPQTYSSVLFWLKPIHKNGGGVGAASWQELDVPVTKTYYLLGENPVRENYYSNFSMSHHMYINYIENEDSSSQFGLEVAHQEGYRSENTFYGISPVPGDGKHVYFGSAPFTPTSVYINSNWVALRDRLIRGFNGNSYLIRDTDVAVTDPGTGETTTQYIAVPHAEIYNNEALVYQKNITNSYRVWDYTTLAYYLSSDGNYTVNITIPTDYPIWNTTYITARFAMPSDDLSPPALNRIRISPRFRTNQTLPVSVNFTDESNVSAVGFFYRADEGPWIQVSLDSEHSGSFIINDSDAASIDIRFMASDSYGNNVTYTVRPASLRARTVDLNFTAGSGSIARGDNVDVYGTCTDSLGYNCSGLRLEYYLDGSYLSADRTDFFFPLYGREAGEYGTNFSIPLATASATVNVSVVFRGSGIYDNRTETITLNVLIYDHDLYLTSLGYPDFRIGQAGALNTSLFNFGLNNEENVNVTFMVNSNITDYIEVAELDAGENVTLEFNWTPQMAGEFNLTVHVQPVAGENYTANNRRSVVLSLGADIETELILPGWQGLLNEAASARIDYSNIGDDNATNVTIELFDLYDRTYVYSPINSSGSATIDGLSYIISPRYLGQGFARVNVTINGTSSFTTAFSDKIEPLSSGRHLFTIYLGSAYAQFYIGTASRITKNGSNVARGASLTDDLNWTPSVTGSHRIVAFVNSSEDRNVKNNYDSYGITVSINAPDIDTSLSADSLLVANVTSEIGLYYENDGTLDAQDINAIFYDIYYYDSTFCFYASPDSVVFADTDYNIASSRLNEEEILINLSYDGATESLRLHDNEIVELSNGILLEVDYFGNSYVTFYLGQANITRMVLTPLAADESKYEYFNFTPTVIGTHRLKVAVNLSEDANWANNYAYTLSSVKGPGPDLSVTITAPSDIIVNSDATVNLTVENSGLQNVSNYTVYLYDMYETEYVYGLYDQAQDTGFNSTQFTITAHRIDDDHILVNVTSDVSELFTIVAYETVQLSDGVYLFSNFIGPSYSQLYLAQGDAYAWNGSSLDVGETRKHVINWSWLNLGEHRLTASVAADTDSDLRNNHDYDSVSVTEDGPDIYVYFTLNASLRVNSTASFAVQFSNYGTRNATNVTAILYELYDADDTYIIYGSIRTATYDGVDYRIAAFDNGSSHVRLQVNHSGISEEHVMVDEELAELQSGHYLMVRTIAPGYTSIEFLKGNKTVQRIADIDVDSAAEVYLNFTPTLPGSRKIIVFANATGEIGLSDNYRYRYTTVRYNGPEAGLDYIGVDARTAVNETNAITVSLINGGFVDAINLKATLFEFTDFEYVYAQYGSTAAEVFNRTQYNITASLSGSILTINLVSNVSSDAIVSSEKTVVQLSDAVYLDIHYIGNSYALMYLAKGTAEGVTLGNITAAGSLEMQVNWTPASVGPRLLVMLLNSSGDADTSNNHAEDGTEAKLYAPDLTCVLSELSRQEVNQTGSVNTNLYNTGLVDAPNVTLRIYDNGELVGQGLLGSFIGSPATVFHSGADDELDNNMSSILINLSSAVNATLSLRARFNTESCCDYAALMLSDDNRTWAERYNFNGSSGWMTYSFNIASYAGGALYLAFRYHTDSSVVYSGFFVHDISVQADQGAVFIDQAINTSYWHFNGFNLTGSSIASEAAKEVFGLNWTPASHGRHHITVALNALGEGDYSDNNCTRRIVAYSNDTHNIRANLGWSLVSFPLLAPNMTARRIFSNSTGFIRAWAYEAKYGDNPWKLYDPDGPSFLNTLSSIDGTLGYWVRSDAADFISIQGGTLEEINTTLYDGWNLMGYPFLQSRPAEEAFENISYFSRAWGYNGSDEYPWKLYDPDALPMLNTLVNLHPGYGYWIRAEEEGGWELTRPG